MKVRFGKALMVAVATLGYATSAHAGTIDFNAALALKGTGYGTRLTILSLQKTPDETGGTTFLNPTGDVPPTDSTNQDSVQTIADLQGIGITGIENFGLVYNLNQTGSSTDPTLSALVVTFYNIGGNPVATFTLSGAFQVPPFDGGVGGSGYPAFFTFSAAEQAAIAALFNSCPTCVVGASATINGSNDGPDSFFLYSVTNAEPFTPVPEPATLAMLGAGLGVVALRLRRKKKD